MSKHQLYHIKTKEKKYVHESELGQYEDNSNWLDYGPVDNSNSDSNSISENESGEVVVELSKIEEGNERTDNNSAKNEQIAELDPFNLTDTQEAFLSDKEIEELQRVELQENPERNSAYSQSYSDMMDQISREGREKKRELLKEDKRKNLKKNLKQHDPKFDPTNSITDLSPQQFAEIVNSDTDPNTELENQVDEMMKEWEEEQFGDSQEDNEEVELSESEARDAISAFEDRGGVFAEFSEEIREENDIEELESDTEPEYTTNISKSGDDATITTSDPSLVEELESAKSESWTNVLEEGTNEKGVKEMTVEIDNFEDNL